MNLIVGPPGSGKTSKLLEIARTKLMEHRRVWWIGLPTQRSYIYRRASEYGAVVGLEATQFQRVYTKLLQEHGLLRPYVGAALRVALAGEAIHMAEGKIPLPGEARLFARAIAELKRYGLGPGDVEPVDQESARLKKVFYQYQRLKEDRMDLDDVRREALRLVEDGNFQLEASLVITDGFRELSPIELRFLKGLASKAEVWVSSPGPVPGIEPAATLPDRGQGLVVYRAPNPVAELRWLLTAIKRDIHVTGLDPLDIALIVPANLVPQVQALASEYQLYLMDESRKSFADFEEGRMLLALLELPDLATPSGLSYIEELEPLSAKAFELGISGNDALLRLSKEVGLEAPYQSWLARLEPSGEPAAWAEKLILSFPQIAASRYKEALLDLAREARWLGAGPDYRRWWSSLISEVSVTTRPKGGVALLTPEAASGRRFKRAYVARANEGIYRAGEREDYFLPEEARRRWEETFNHAGLPERIRGRDQLLWAELRTRGDTTVITFPEADQGGLLEPESILVGKSKDACEPLPPLPPASRPLLKEAARITMASAPPDEVRLGNLEDLLYFARCPVQFWTSRVIAPKRERGPLRDALSQLARTGEITGPLGSYRDLLAGGRAYARVDIPEIGVSARPDFLKLGDKAQIIRLEESDDLSLGTEEAREVIKRRWTELLASRTLLETPEVQAVEVFVLPLGGRPVLAYEFNRKNRNSKAMQSLLDKRYQEAVSAWQAYQSKMFEARPGNYCRDCGFGDICRVKELEAV